MISKHLVIGVTPILMEAARLDAVFMTEQEMFHHLGMEARVMWTVELSQRWPDGGYVHLPWDESGEAPEDAIMFFCRGLVEEDE